jgi:hypothetical protein
MEAPPCEVPPPDMALLPLPVADMPAEDDMPDEEDRPEEEDRPLETSPVPPRLLLPPRVELPVPPEVGKGLEVEAMDTLLCFRTLGVCVGELPTLKDVARPDASLYTAPGRPQGSRQGLCRGPP